MFWFRNANFNYIIPIDLKTPYNSFLSMARLRKAVCYRKLERPYTRKSKFRQKSFIRANPNTNIAKFQTGNNKKDFLYSLNLLTKQEMQIRSNALESARMTSNRLLEKSLGKNDYLLKMRVYPHHVLRENPIAAGAGADRFSTGMKKSFGKPIGVAARLKEGQAIFEVGVNKEGIKTAKQALERASKKLPCGCRIEIIENKSS